MVDNMKSNDTGLNKISKIVLNLRQSSVGRVMAFALLIGTAIVFSNIGVAAGRVLSSLPPDAYQALHWRNVGPFRGGRTTAVTGVVGHPDTFYIGSSGGGVWKTENAGADWHNISDGFIKVGSIGAITVAPSNSNTIYVGTGEAPIRKFSTNPGDGVYKSTNGGKTWEFLGLKETRHISAIIVDPGNPDVVYVGAEGNPWTPTDERGVYRSSDGGKTWQKVLFVNKTTGVHSLSMDPKDPRVLYAAMWDHQVKPWYYRSGGPGSGLWKSTDGGSHWERLHGGLPEEMGNTAVSVSGADSNRVYALIEAKHGGIFRSDDAGKTWQLVNDDMGIRERFWYYTHIFADPQEKDTVHVLGNTWEKSVDGGKTLTGIRPPHGDNHDLWINPRNNRILVEGNDGGATVSLDGGHTFSSQYNQPTGQFYRVFADNGFPYRLYGAQQDRETVSLPSQAGGGISVADEYGVGGGESAQISMDANNPRYVYATGLLGGLTEYDQRTGVTRRINPSAEWAGYRNVEDQQYRFSWTPPVVVSQQSPDSIYVGAQVVLKSTDRGYSWKEISPDLTRNDKSKQGAPSGPFYYGGGAGYWGYGEITYIQQSPIAADTLWVGSDDGMVHVTRDGGKHWSDVTPPGLGDAAVHAIEASPHDQAKAYVVASRYWFGDYKPMIYRTDDYGSHWKLVVSGIPADDYTLVVREDPVRAGLLYAGTVTGVYVSFDDGNSWQRFQSNLPTTPVTDLKVHGNDLVASTEGRGFWVLDDLSPLRQMNDKVLQASMYLYQPSPAYRAGFSRADVPGPFGKNPPNGVVFRYSFAKAPDTGSTPVVLEILGKNGDVIRKFTSTPVHVAQVAVRKGVRVPRPAPAVPAKAGMNSYAWDMRVGGYTATADTFRNVNSSPYRVAPGTYRVRLSYGGQSVTRDFQILQDPRAAQPTDAEWAKQQTFLADLRGRVNEINSAHNRIRYVAQQARKLMESAGTGNGASRISASGQTLVAKIGCWEQQYKQPKLPGDFQDLVSFPSRSWAIPMFNVVSLADEDPPVKPNTEMVADRLEKRWTSIEAEMRAIVDGPLATFNEKVRQAGLQTIELPTDTPAPPPPVVNISPNQCHEK
jgi:photosystem II stability/assembly factor-like uncharacterized protein